MSEDDMDRAFAAAGVAVDAVLVFLNSPRTSDNPWASFVGPARLIADGTATATRVLRHQKREPDAQKPRLVVLNALGAGESRAVTPWLMKLLIDYSHLTKTYKDHNAVDAEIEGNCGDDVLWTVNMAVGLGDAGDKPVKTFGSKESGAGWFLTRESCAKWMVDVASGKHGDEFNNKRVITCN